MKQVLPELKDAFAHAVHALAEEPTAENVVRYLLASRELELRGEIARPEPHALVA